MCKDRDCVTDAKNARWQRLHARLIFATSQILGEPGTGYNDNDHVCRVYGDLIGYCFEINARTSHSFKTTGLKTIIQGFAKLSHNVRFIY